MTQLDQSLRTLIVVPTYNEVENLEPLASAILTQREHALLIVDDNSPDGTGRLAERLAERWSGRIAILHRPDKQGIGTAYIAGFREAVAGSYDYVVQMDADFSHDPADVLRLIEAMHGADVAIGSRYVAGGEVVNWPWLRWAISRGGSFYTQIVLGLPVSDPTSGFKCFRRAALARLDLDAVRTRGFGFQVEMNWLSHRQGLRLVEVPIRFVDRKVGQSKMSRQIFFEALWRVWQLRFRPAPSKRPDPTTREQYHRPSNTSDQPVTSE